MTQSHTTRNSAVLGSRLALSSCVHAEAMSMTFPSAHAQVGLVLVQVRHDFSRSSPEEPGGRARAAKALNQAFELLNCCSHDRPEDSFCCGRGSGDGGEDHRDQEDAAGKILLFSPARNAKLLACSHTGGRSLVLDCSAASLLPLHWRTLKRQYD